ncbi:MAG: hypothetical protein JNM70_03705 [Anaerolineae bacterium]|nr:hypothetical protein [Anaerolineae bacterium]
MAAAAKWQLRAKLSHVSSVLPEMLQMLQKPQMQIPRKVAKVENVAVATARHLQQRWDAIIACDKL